MPPPPTKMPPASAVQGSAARPAKPKKTPPPTPFAMKPITALWVFLLFNTLAALTSPIEDCDETFNYWEPTHYLAHSYGLQTWEYSPVYSIRSWAYVGLHALVGSFRRLLPFPTKVGEFYFIRYALAFVCAVCQTQLFRVISITLNPRIALFFLMAMISSPGVFRASTAFLPSSFAMYTTMLGMAAFINWRGGLRTATGVFWFAVGGVLGWPFSVALALPFLVEEGVLAVVNGREAFIAAVMRLLKGVGASLLVVLAEFTISSTFYRLPTLVPLNIVLYNVFSPPHKGPNIYGTEPWSFYIRNLLLNFHIFLPLALASLPLFILLKLFSRQPLASGLRTLVFISPFYLWLAIFSCQPHKEERFMYPAYPALALNAAISLHILLAALGQSSPRTLIGRVPAGLKLLLVLSTLGTSIILGFSRILGAYDAFSAPLHIYEPLQSPGVAVEGGSLCLGKDWYRFPSSYFLPEGMRARFVRSEFRGLLPGQFAGGQGEGKGGWWSGTWRVPEGMNDENLEDVGKYVDIATCDFLVDTHFPSSTPSALEPAYMLDTETWEVVRCERFMDAGRTGLMARLGWVPLGLGGERVYGEHCLLKRRVGGK
ncbi:hypothetical protein VE00_10096 [Pseudogymnoascus sp. WSF 3629]|nr:hypothetical protein VE00_10096 [Pseudogymnoascus sp. WSF 3629]